MIDYILYLIAAIVAWLVLRLSKTQKTCRYVDESL